MRKLLPFIAFLLTALIVGSCTTTTETEPEVKSNGHDSIYSELLSTYRHHHIHLPKDYNESDLTYPVLFVLDGSTHYHYTKTLVDFLSDTNNIAEMIVVSIDHPNRFDDLSYSPDRIVEHESNAPVFTEYMTKELIPYINTKYRTQGRRILFGHSLASMYTINLIVRGKEHFSGLIASGPFFDRDTSLVPFIISEINENDQVPPLYLGKEMYANAKDSAGWVDLVNHLEVSLKPHEFKGTFYPEATHESVAPLSLVNGLIYLKEVLDEKEK